VCGVELRNKEEKKQDDKMWRRTSGEPIKVTCLGVARGEKEDPSQKKKKRVRAPANSN